jgi:nitrous oxide reductase accessory protein NosL
MMKLYLNEAQYVFDRKKITAILVMDYRMFGALPARRAYYVILSDRLSPMGNDLLPFKTKQAAQAFIKDHGGQIVRFSEITLDLIRQLDWSKYPKKH